jgi:hypothetical protein
VVVFHAAEDRQVSTDRLAALKAGLPNAFLAFVARRDQAPQIGYLLEKGADRCFVEPLYPAEITKALRQITARQR